MGTGVWGVADAVLVIRVWLEPGHPAAFRARLLGIDLCDPAAAVVVTSPEQLLDAVHRWLDDCLPPYAPQPPTSR